MVGLLAPAVVAALLALAFPRVAERRALRIEWWPAALAAFALELVLYNPPTDTQPWAMTAGPWLWLCTKVVMILVVLRNLRARGRLLSPLLLALVGLALNTLVIAANDGYMPQSVAAATQVWGDARPIHNPTARLHNTRPLTDDTPLAGLADVYAQPTWLPRPNVVSIGDILLSIGIAGWIFQALRGSRPPMTLMRSAPAGGIVGATIGGTPIHAAARGPAPHSRRREASAPPSAGQYDPALWT